MTINQELSEIYGNRYKSVDLKRKNKIWKIIVENVFQKEVLLSDVVVDIAFGHGEFINNIKSLHKIAIDLNPESGNFLNSDIRYINQDVFSALELIKDSVDIIFISNFLEHLNTKNDLMFFLKLCYGSLKSGGKLLIVGPNIRYLPGIYWDFMDHHLALSHHTVTEALELSGFKINNVISKFLPHSERGSSLPNPFIPWIYIKIPFLWRFFGKQFYIVSRKP
jgi:SAM-dependent methyltransferase